MGLYNFEPRFVPFILNGSKRHTIRSQRKHPDQPGKLCHLYTGLRHPGAFLLMRAPCVRIENIHISRPGIVLVNSQMLDPTEREALAQADGFLTFLHMLNFWEGKLPFFGQIIHWDFTKRVAD